MAGFKTNMKPTMVPQAHVPAPTRGRALRPPTMHIPQTRRYYGKAEQGAEQPRGVSEGQKSNFGQTGLTGET